MAYEVRTEAFAGPLDVLVKLVAAQEVDIWEVSLTRLVDDFVAVMAAVDVRATANGTGSDAAGSAGGGRIDMEVASEFALLAATLIELKSRRLLPEPTVELDLEEELAAYGLRDAAFARLVEGRTFGAAARLLRERWNAAALRWPRTAGPEERFVAAAPELYHRQDPPPDEPLERMGLLRDTEIIADSEAVLDSLDAAADRAAGRPTGVVGFCMGGRAAYLLAAASARLQAAVAFYGGNTRVAWGEGAAPFERLDEIRCPVLGFFGGRDSNPSPEDRDAIDAELTRHGVEHRFHSFAGAGHGYMDFTNATRYHTEAATDSWPLTLEFLSRHLAPGS